MGPNALKYVGFLLIDVCVCVYILILVIGLSLFGTFTNLFVLFYVYVFMLYQPSTRPFCNTDNGFTCVQSTLPRYNATPDIRLEAWKPQSDELLDALLVWNMCLF